MDEQRLSQVFRDAVEEPPPASFGHHDVVAASRRATTQQRSMLAGGTLLGAAVLAGGLVGGGLVGGGLVGGGLVADDQGMPSAGDAASAPGRETDPGTLSTLDVRRCGPIDAELVTDLKALLANRGSVASGPASEVPEQCPPGSRAAAVPVTGGVLSVLLVEPGPVGLARPDDGARVYSVPWEGGRTLTVISTPGTPGQPAPLADEVPGLARDLAAAL
ncbi:MAG: hypothetical protein ACRDTA_12185 [Pseudonocardiaceae bacterium]